MHATVAACEPQFGYEMIEIRSKSRILLIVGVASFAANARAQSGAECRSIEDNVKRLFCYDNLVDGARPAAKHVTGNIIASFAGYRTSSTRPFTVSGPWKMHWSVDDGSISIVLLSAAGKIVDYYGIADRATTGSAYLAKGGTFSLEAITNGRWEIQVMSTP